jgi:ATP synthase subunit 6
MNMINRLFSSFDPSLRLFSLNYLSFSLPLIALLINKIYIIVNRLHKITQNSYIFLLEEMKASLPKENTKGKIIILLSLFYIIIIINVLGLFPYVFTLTAHLSLTLSLALPFWICFLLFNATKNTKHFLAHLVPLGTPLILSQFITIIESVRLIIRPITLSVRLAANITAGHILIALCRSPIILINRFSAALTLLLLLEIAVAFIQAYVFVTLVSIYLRETYETNAPISYSIYKTLTPSNKH